MTKTILIAEDNLTNLKLIRDILTAQGYELIEALDGEEAAERINKNKNDLDLILMDIQLPKLNGLDVIKNIKQDSIAKNIPVFVVSAHAMADDIEKAKHAGCEEYITKPINIVEFIEKVDRYLK